MLKKLFITSLFIVLMTPNASYAKDSSALRYEKQRCENGNLEICDKLGSAYIYGSSKDHIEKDISQAIYYLEKGCYEGPTFSCSDLGFLYESGTGVEQDKKKAISFYDMACDQGYTLLCDRASGLRLHLRMKGELPW